MQQVIAEFATDLHELYYHEDMPMDIKLFLLRRIKTIIN
jgi:hypothetical protein